MRADKSAQGLPPRQSMLLERQDQNRLRLMSPSSPTAVLHDAAKHLEGTCISSPRSDAAG